VTTLQSCILAILFLLCAVTIPATAAPLFFGFATVALTWALYSVALTFGKLETVDGLVWGH
jgi:hypothetical protein